MTFKKSLRTFLEHCHNKIKSDTILVCMGNESCDIDSFVSSLVVAMHEEAIFVVNISRHILESKGDVMHILNQYNINLDQLIFLERSKGRDAVDAVFRIGKEEHRLIDKRVILILVDHHEPVPELSGNEIDLIIDHHMLEKQSLGSRRIYADVDVGSCATLVCKYIGHSLFHSKFTKNSYFASDDFCAGIAKLLMIPISIDTSNFKKVTSHFDRGEFKKLSKLADFSKKKMNKLRKKIKKMRLNDDNLDNEIILMKDYKEFQHKGLIFGIATVKYSFKEWADREKCLESVFNDFRMSRCLDFLMINRKNGSKRFLAVINVSFENLMAKENDFRVIDHKYLHYYEIPVNKSRKIMVPIIKELIDRTYT